MKCPSCGKKMRPKVLPEYDVADLLGLKSVKIKNMPALVCKACGDVLVPGGLLEGATRILTHEMITGAFLLGDVEVRFLRKAARLTQQKLADLLGVDRVTVARWETGEVAVPPTASPAIRMILVAHGVVPGLELPKENFRKPPEPRPSHFDIPVPTGLAATL